jgi:glyoxylase-like metal-dependent hydrolase (beta-lactamase superfamily II)
MNQLAEDVWQIPLVPRNLINAYLVGDVLVDAGMVIHGRKVVAAIAGRGVATHVLTHVHNDHAGGTKHVKETLGLPVWVGAGDAEALRTGKAIPPPSVPGGSLLSSAAGSPAVEPDRELREGEELGHGFVVLETPGHSPGHLSFWRESDGTLICGDVFFGMNVFTGIYGLRQPPGIFTYDPPLNRRSERRLAELKPKLVLFGHGPPLREPAKLNDFVAALPDG